MRIITYKTLAGLQLGVVTERGILDVKSAHKAAGESLLGEITPITPESFFEQGLSAIPKLETFVKHATSLADYLTWILDEVELEFGPCVPEPGKILCVGLNYHRHAVESGLAPSDSPVLFSKFNNTIAAHNEPVPLPSNALECDYEAELVVVIGKRGKYIPLEQALNYVMGYCNGNDLSARDLQMLTSQWLLGKTLDKFLPLGPYLVTRDEIGDPQDMPVRCWLNGELRQESNTADMIFPVAEIIHYASQYMTLEPGDIISTGTPEGVILGMKEKVWLKPGDRAEIQIGNLGKLSSSFVAEV
jgi:2-keto-4-pentenoate hydratase/2-oxohepta-3-ene-1,7-dioic acid hydratase in catechol pathway